MFSLLDWCWTQWTWVVVPAQIQGELPLACLEPGSSGGNWFSSVYVCGTGLEVGPVGWNWEPTGLNQHCPYGACIWDQVGLGNATACKPTRPLTFASRKFRRLSNAAPKLRPQGLGAAPLRRARIWHLETAPLGFVFQQRLSPSH